MATSSKNEKDDVPSEEEFFIRISKNYDEDNDNNILSDKNINQEIFKNELEDKTLLDLLKMTKFEAQDFDDNNKIKEKLNNAFKALIKKSKSSESESTESN